MARPPTDPALVAEAVALVAGGMRPEDAAEQLRGEGKEISGRTIRRALPPGGPSALPAPAAVAPPVAPAAKAPLAAKRAPALPQGGAPPPAADMTIATVRRIAAARCPAFVAELEEGLVAWTRGEEELDAWLTRPFPPAPRSESVDLEASALQLIADLQADFRRAPITGGRRTSISGEILSALRELRQILGPRPVVQAPDAVLAALARLDADFIKRVEEHAAHPITAAEIAA